MIRGTSVAAPLDSAVPEESVDGIFIIADGTRSEEGCATRSV